MNIKYVVAECRQNTDMDKYADIIIDDGPHTFVSVEPAENIKAAILISMDIERINPKHKVVVLHHESLQKLIDGITGVQPCLF